MPTRSARNALPRSPYRPRGRGFAARALWRLRPPLFGPPVRSAAGRNIPGQKALGQAILEYVLALAIVLSIITIVSTGFRKTLFRIWEFYGKQITAPCPGCAADPSIRLR